MKSSCAACGGKLGLGTRFANYWAQWTWHHKRFCSTLCAERFDKDAQIAKEQRTWHAFLNGQST